MLAVSAIALGTFWFGVMVGIEHTYRKVQAVLLEEAQKANHDRRYDEALMLRQYATKLRGD